MRWLTMWWSLIDAVFPALRVYAIYDKNIGLGIIAIFFLMVPAATNLVCIYDFSLVRMTT